MTELWAFTYTFLAFGIFSIGIYAGEQNLVRQERQTNHLHIEQPGTVWFVMGLIAIIVGITMAIIASYPAEELIDHANRVRSQYATEEALK